MTQITAISTDFKTRKRHPQTLELSPNPSLLIRLAVEGDGPDVWDLADTYRDVYRDDYNMEGFNALTILNRIHDEEVMVVVFKGDVIGAVYVNDIHEDRLHAHIHFLMQSGYWPAAVKCKWFHKIISAAFDFYGVDKFKASFLPRQKTAKWLMDHLGFRYVGTEFDETKVDGIKMNRMNFELKRNYWERRR